MKALFISNDPQLFEEGSAVRARMRTYADAIGELHIISAASLRARAATERNLFLYPVCAPRFLRIRSLTKRASAVIAAHGIEVVSAQDPFEHGLVALKATRGTSAKLHIQIHTDFLSPWFLRSGNARSPSVPAPFLNRMRIRWADQVLPHADAVRVVSRRIKESLVQRYGDRVKEPAIVPIHTPSDPPAAMPLVTPFRYTLIAVGRLEPEKRIEDLLAALAKVVPKYPMVGLAIVGEGRERARLERMADTLGLSHNVVFLGGRSDAWALMRSAHCFIQASAYEGYGRTLIEAALGRVPIITTDVGIVGEVLKGYDDALVAPVADPTALSYHIVGMLEDVAARLALVQNAEAAARTHLAAVHNLPGDIATDLARAL